METLAYAMVSIFNSSVNMVVCFGDRQELFFLVQPIGRMLVDPRHPLVSAFVREVDRSALYLRLERANYDSLNGIRNDLTQRRYTVIGEARLDELLNERKSQLVHSFYPFYYGGMLTHLLRERPKLRDRMVVLSLIMETVAPRELIHLTLMQLVGIEHMPYLFYFPKGGLVT